MTVIVHACGNSQFFATILQAGSNTLYGVNDQVHLQLGLRVPHPNGAYVHTSEQMM